MKLILKQDVPNLGTLGDIVDVKPGYARNYLLPRGMALPATSQESKEFRHHMQYLTKQRQQEVDRARQRAALMKVLELEITRKAGPGGRLFGSVTNRDIQALLEEAGYSLERRSILLPGPIRNVGTHPFTVRIHTEVSLELTLKVTAEYDPEQAAALAAAAAAEAQAATAAEAEADAETEDDADEYVETADATETA